MSRGGRGGGRGGRGGRGGGGAGRPVLSWDNGDEPDARPSELFPPYTVPTPTALNPFEKDSVKHFLLLRHQIHASSLYTSRRTLDSDPLAPRKMYRQEQTNAHYGVQSRASQDPFTSVPTYGQRFVREERALPDWSRRVICRELFPEDILDVIEPQGERKKRKLELTSVNALPNAEQAFGLVANGEEGEDGARGGDLLERLDAIPHEEGEEEPEGEEEEEEQDEVYDDEDAGDYDAENYFDNGDEYGDDYGDDGGDGEGTY
ncbi:unnamed protein product [Clonostachys solani]|uniref:DNA-directed RNA polymerase III subunit n=1 Tax=Clonostachys solani TaxID=160281 RepID=A0A9N9ZNC0_9HYPO|nr:unnamed protein product [Clonostachys solani]